MKKLLSLFKKKDGAVLMTAISFMAVAVALCGVITTYVLIMTKTATSYTSVNENKLIADRIAEDYMSYVSTTYSSQNSISYTADGFNNEYTAYADYIESEGYEDDAFYCNTT
ncbi:MAG: hypothetical protein LUD27_01095, partial [Clostridia bacterium]|nr:hypothetical protein [Clostridia bacterium]